MSSMTDWSCRSISTTRRKSRKSTASTSSTAKKKRVWKTSKASFTSNRAYGVAKMAGKIAIMETVLRDAHQCLVATRMRTEDMLPIAAELDDVGYWSLEPWDQKPMSS